MPCHNGGTGRAWPSCGLSRASEGEPSDGISCDTPHTQMVSLLQQSFIYLFIYV